MNDDELLARLRASFQATAARTTISSGRLDELTLERPATSRRPLVATMSAAAGVAVIAAVAAVTASTGPSGERSVSPASGGNGLAASAPAPTEPASSASQCVPENYYVTASKQQVAGLTYMLPSTPAGYELYGAWGTISRNGCVDSATWYVEYDRVGASDGGGAIQIEVNHVGDAYPMPAPPTSTSVTVAGHEGSFLDLNGKGVGVVSWTDGNADIKVFAPLSNGRDAFLSLAGSVVQVPVDDPRIQPPANCDVPPGEVCSVDRPKAMGSSSPAATATAAAQGGVPIG